MTPALYVATAIALVALAHVFIRPLSRAAAIVVIALPLLFTGYALVTGGVYGPIDHPYQSPPLSDLKQQYGIGDPHNIAVTDVYAQMFPWRRVVQLSYARGEWPLWNPYMLNGHLLAAAAQPAAYSPFTLLACLLPVAQSFTYSAAIAFLLAALTAFLLARSLGCSEGAALIGAAAWMCSTSMIMYVETPMGFTWTCAPLVLLAAKRVVHAPGFASGLLLTITLALVLLMGHPESVLLPVLVACVYAVYEMRGVRLAPLVTAVLAGIAAALLCAIYLLPLQEAVSQSGEYYYKTKYWAHESRALPPMQVAQNLLQDVFPQLYLRKWTRPELPLPRAESFAVGSVALALAIFGIVRRRSWFFLTLIVIFIAVGSGWGPAANALQHVPLLKITHNERLVFAAALLLSMLAAIGANELDRRAAITLAIVLGVLTCGTIAVSRSIESLPNQWGAYKIAAELAFLGAAIVVAAIPRARFTLPALLALLVAQRVVEDSGAHKTFPARAAYPHIATFDALANVKEPFRIAGLGTNFIPATSVFYGLEDARGYEALTFFPTAKTFPLWCVHQPIWFNRIDDLSRPFLSFLNVRYAIADAAPPGWRKIGDRLFENDNVMPRVSVPRVARIGLSDEDALAEMLRETDFRERVWISADQRGERVNGPGAVTLVSRRLGGEYQLDADMHGDGWIVVSDTAWKGWRAYIDGRRVTTTRANIAFLSVFVPKGKHAVRLVYWPESFVIGRAISALTLLALIVAERRRPRRLNGRRPAAP